MSIKEDRALIDRLGGPSKLAALLGYGPNGVQRISNWKVRGIPARVKLEHPRIFLKAMQPRKAK
jgi:hypothetical protein